MLGSILAIRARIRRQSRGQSVVEFALLLPIFMLFFVAVLDLGRMSGAQIAVTNAAREGAFQAAKTPTDFTKLSGCPADGATNRVYCRVKLESSGGVTILPGDVTVVCSHPTCATGIGSTVTVSVDGHFQLFTPLMGVFFGGQDVTFTASSTQQRETLPVSGASATPTASPSPSASPSAAPSASASVAPSTAPCTLPSAGFTYTTSPKSDKAPVSLLVTDTSTSIACGMSSWFWDFGDNTTSTVQSPTSGGPHVYRVKGTYTITLIVTNAAGSATTGGVQITVKP